MIGWSGFCAKVTEFVISKATGHAVTYWFDQKRSVARALVRLYETLQKSSELLEHLLRVFDEAVEKKKPIAFSKDLVPFEGRITRLTQDVAAQYNNLIHAIHIFDPRLAELLTSVEGFKFTAVTPFGLWLRKARFAIEFDGLHPFTKVSFTTFQDEIANINLDDIIEAQQRISAESRSLRSIPTGKRKYTHVVREPNKLVEALSVLLVKDEFTASDFEKVRYLRDRLRMQATLLERVLPMLRQFIAENFTLSDIL
jgi:hypothetical protein